MRHQANQGLPQLKEALQLNSRLDQLQKSLPGYLKLGTAEAVSPFDGCHLELTVDQSPYWTPHLQILPLRGLSGCSESGHIGFRPLVLNHKILRKPIFKIAISIELSVIHADDFLIFFHTAFIIL